MFHHFSLADHIIIVQHCTKMGIFKSKNQNQKQKNENEIVQALWVVSGD